MAVPIEISQSDGAVPVKAGGPATPAAPVAIIKAGSPAARRFWEFFAGQIPNPNTREAYLRAAFDFFGWLEGRGMVELPAIEPLHVAAYVQDLRGRYAVPTVKQRLAALRMLFDWLVIGQVVPVNPAASVRGPKHVVTRGKTPVLDPSEARQLLDSISTDTIAGLRDRALIGVLLFSFARIGAALSMNVEDVYSQGRRLWLRLHEKGGKRHDMPAHHTLEADLDAYLSAGGLRPVPKGALFRTLARAKGRPLSDRRLPRRNALHMIERRARAAGLASSVNCHSFRATGITAYLSNGGQLETARAMAAHASTKTTQLYDRRQDQVSLDEIERIVI